MSNQKGISAQPSDIRFLKRLKLAIEQNYDNSDFGVQDLALAVKMSRYNLFRKTKTLFDKSPIELIKGRRLNESRRLLQNSKMSVAHVGYSVGFSDPSYFHRAFKDRFGMTPTQWRKFRDGNSKQDNLAA